MGGGSNDAQKEAQQAEAERMAQIQATQRRINSIFDAPGRERDIQSVVDAERQFLGRDLSEKNADAARQLKFALARNGQTQGSYDVDTHKKLGRDYLQAALDVERRSQQTGAGLRGADQQSKMNLFSLASQGLDMTTAARQAADSMRANLETSRAAATQDGIGDAFSNLASIWKDSKEAAGANKATRYQYGSDPFYATAGAGAANGPFG